MVVLELDEHVRGAEGLHETPEERLAVGGAPLERGEQGAPAAAGEEDETFGALGVEEGGERQGRGLARRLHVRLREEATEVGVALLGLGEEGDVVLLVREAVAQRELRARDRRTPFSLAPRANSIEP